MKVAFNKKSMTIAAICVLLLIFTWLMGFAFGKTSKIKAVKSNNVSDEISKIRVELVSIQDMSSSGTGYTLKLVNGSPYTIKQNSVYISYLIRTGENTHVVNKCKAEATGNKLNIAPNESVILSVFIPKENYENNKLIEKNAPQFEIKGYINEVSDINHFEKSGGLE